MPRTVRKWSSRGESGGAARCGLAAVLAGRLAAALALVATLAGPLPAADLPCGALAPADIAGLGFDLPREGSAGSWRSKVSLDSNAAIFGREAECLWSPPGGTVTLIVGDFDANVVKGEQIRTLARKVLAAIQTEMKSQEQFTGSRWTIAPLPGVGEEAFVASLNRTYFHAVAYQGPRLVRLAVDAGGLGARAPAPEAVAPLVRKALAARTGYSSAGAPPANPREATADPGQRARVSGSIVATGSLSGTFTWNEPNAVEAYPDKLEVTLNTADKSSWMNLQVFRDGRVEVRSGKLRAGKLTGTGGKASYDALAAKGSVRVDGTVAGGAEKVSLRGSLSFEPPRR